MKPDKLKYLDVDETLDWITNADRKDVPSKYLIDGRGIRNTEQGFVFQRDYGTQQRRASYPTPSSPTTSTMRRGAAMKFKDFTLESDIVVCLDSNSRYHIYQYDGVGTGGWTHFNESYTAQINATPAASATSVVLKTVLDAFGNTPTIADDALNEFFIWNISADIAITARPAYITDTTASGATPSITTPVILGSSGLGWAVDQYVVIYRSTGVMHHLAPTARVTSPSAENLGDYKAYDLGATASYDLHAQFLSTESLNKCVVMLGSRLKTTEVTTMKTPLRIQYDASRPFFYDTNGNPLINPSSTTFWCEEGFGALETDCQYGKHTNTVVYGDSPSNPIPLNRSGSTTPSGTIDVGETGRQWLRVGWSAATRTYEVTTGKTSTKWGFFKVVFRVAVTVLYDDYQESDPIIKWFFNYDSPVDGTGVAKIPSMTISSINVNYANMNKNITGLRWYVDVMGDGEIIQAGYPDADSNYTYFAETNFQRSQINANATAFKQVWTLTTNLNYPYGCVPAGWERTPDDWYNYAAIDCGYLAEGAMFGLSTFNSPFGPITREKAYTRKAGQEETIGETVGVTLSSCLGRASVAADREKFKPLFAVASNRIAGAIIVAAEDDTTLRMTHYDGFGSHNDEVFPNVKIDNTGAVTKVSLSGKGRMYGMGVLDSVVYVFRRNYVETYDLHSGVQRIYDADCISPDGIVFSEEGILWAGSSDIYGIFKDSGQIQVLSNDIHNLWIGAKTYTRSAVTQPIVSMTAKKACIAGYDASFKEAWFSLLWYEDTASEYCVLRYSFTQRKWLPPRSFGTTGTQVPLWLMRSPTDAIGRRMVIGMSDRMLMYPSFLAAGVPLYLDNVASTVTTDDDSGDEFRLWGTINIGEIYSMVVNAALYDIIIDTSITYTSGQGADVFTIEPFVNDETTALGTWSQLFNALPFTRKLTPRGQIEALTIKIMAAVTQNHKKFEVRKITLGLVESGRIGNR